MQDERGDRDGTPPSGQGSLGVEARYTDAGEIGRGGVGRIHDMRDKRLLRSVAMKTLDPALGRDPKAVARFIEEAQIQAQLDHPNVAPIHDLGVDSNGHVHFTMKLVRGRSFASWLDDPTRPPGSPERLADGIEIFLKICDAITFAHAHGVLHRDLKPQNIMVGDFGEVYVMDWGLALTTGANVVLSTGTRAASGGEQNAIVGTPAYLPPEVARGQPFDEQSDVFALGCILYAIVTGDVVYGRQPMLPTLLAARRGAVIAPEHALRGIVVSPKLLRILSKSVAPERADRTESAAALKLEVQRFLRGGLHLPRQEFAPGMRIVVEGDAGESAFLIATGTCEAYKMVGGARHTLRRMGPGEIFGETAVLSSYPRTATVEAVDTVTVLVIERATLEDGIGLDTWLGTLVKALAHRFRELDARSAPGG